MAATSVVVNCHGQLFLRIEPSKKTKDVHPTGEAFKAWSLDGLETPSLVGAEAASIQVPSALSYQNVVVGDSSVMMSTVAVMKVVNMKCCKLRS